MEEEAVGAGAAEGVGGGEEGLAVGEEAIDGGAAARHGGVVGAKGQEVGLELRDARVGGENGGLEIVGERGKASRTSRTSGTSSTRLGGNLQVGVGFASGDGVGWLDEEEMGN